MEDLSRRLLSSGFNFGSDIKIGTDKPMVEKVLQFGEGNFLRAFVDYMIDELNSHDLFNGSVVVAQPIKQGMVDMLNAQDGLYTLFLRGLEGGKEVCSKKIITSISRGINPYTEYENYFLLAKNPDLRIIVSNTTEAGIAYNKDDKLSDTPQISFPAKVTAFLFERFKIFSGDMKKGFIFIPCELIDNNGTNLKKIVLQYAKEWNLGDSFIDWVENANVFTNTLVDRIVTGYPRDEVEKITKELNYKDNLLNTGEIFHFWVIEAPKKWLDELKEELPFDKIGLNVVWTDDVTNYKARKVRILNGGHTMTVLAAYLAGKDTVGQLMEDKAFNTYLQKGLFDEIIPTLDLDYDDLKSFADAVFDRFANPFIKHYLLSIALNSVSKYKARVLPSILEYHKRKGELPKILSFSFAALACFYKGTEIVDGALVGDRAGAGYKIADDLFVLEFFKELWSDCDMTKDSVGSLVKKLCGNQEFWGMDLNTVGNFSDIVTEYVYNIGQNGISEEVKKLICQ